MIYVGELTPNAEQNRTLQRGSTGGQQADGGGASRNKVQRQKEGQITWAESRPATVKGGKGWKAFLQKTIGQGASVEEVVKRRLGNGFPLGATGEFDTLNEGR